MAGGGKSPRPQKFPPREDEGQAQTPSPPKVTLQGPIPWLILQGPSGVPPEARSGDPTQNGPPAAWMTRLPSRGGLFRRPPTAHVNKKIRRPPLGVIGV